MVCLNVSLGISWLLYSRFHTISPFSLIIWTTLASEKRIMSWNFTTPWLTSNVTSWQLCSCARFLCPSVVMRALGSHPAGVCAIVSSLEIILMIKLKLILQFSSYNYNFTERNSIMRLTLCVEFCHVQYFVVKTRKMVFQKLWEDAASFLKYSA